MVLRISNLLVQTTSRLQCGRNLHEAAMEDSQPSLSQTIDQTPLILTSSPSPPPSSSTDTPLHVAALVGDLESAKSLLTQNPNLAGKPNSDGSTPLHLASAEGYVGIVKTLVSLNPNLGFALDRDGRSPFHLACIKGRVGVVTELVRVNPGLARGVTGGGGGESCLHLCVKHNRLEALKVVVEGCGEDDQFVNWKDADGNTVLHLAVAKKQLEIIKFLLVTTAIDVSIRNAHGLTALDALSESPRDLRDMEIKQCLQGGGVSTRFDSNGKYQKFFRLERRKSCRMALVSRTHHTKE